MEGNFANFDGVGRDVNTKHKGIHLYCCSPIGKAWESISHTRIPKILALFEGCQDISGLPELVLLPRLCPNDQRSITGIFKHLGLHHYREVGFSYAEE